MSRFLSDQWDTITDYWSNVWDDIKELIADQFNLIKDFWAEIWDDVSGFFLDQWDLIRGFWSQAFSDLYVWLDQALTGIWTYFVKVVIPTFMDGLKYVIESEPVQWVIEFVMKSLEALFGWIFDVDEAELQKWAKKGAEFMRDLVETEPV